jgi:hypothetical protein
MCTQFFVGNPQREHLHWEMRFLGGGGEAVTVTKTPHKEIQSVWNAGLFESKLAYFNLFLLFIQILFYRLIRVCPQSQLVQ